MWGESYMIFYRNQHSLPAMIIDFYDPYISVVFSARYEKRVKRLLAGDKSVLSKRLTPSLLCVNFKKEVSLYIKMICMGVSPKAVVRQYLEDKKHGKVHTQ